MRLFRWKLAILLTCAGLEARAQEIVPVSGCRLQSPYCPCPAPYLPETAPIPQTRSDAPTSQTPATNAFNEALASAGEGGTQPAAGYAPGFFGDFLGSFGTQFINVNGVAPRFGFVPLVNHAGGIKVTDNESPRPMDRLFYNYNFFNFVNRSSNTDMAPMELHRHIFGFEKTFLDGFASVGLRLPIVQLFGPPEVATSDFADMTIVTKMAIWDNRATGNLVSAGLLISVPTGPPQTLVSPASGNRFALDDTILQPFVGGIYNASDRLYFHGFSAIAIPTDSKDATVMWNDAGIGYWMYRNLDDRLVQGLVPTVEFHVNTPLNHRGKSSLPLGVSDTVDLTAGGYVVFARATLGGAVGMPMTGPKPFGVEAVGQYTMRF